ncbi:MAG TPA: hypothetical protein VNV66_02640 [Pilimelia sp.]|nr:hypothetical protein [Pilimelia sp.]
MNAAPDVPAMDAVLHAAALGCAAGGLVAGAAALAASHRARVALPVVLDLWLAAGLLRLTASPGWVDLLAAAALVAVRQLVIRALARSAAGGPPGRCRARVSARRARVSAAADRR